jgi:hypothetical protein
VTGLRISVNEADTDLVIAGTHGRTALVQAFLGSVASRILGGAEPTAVIRTDVLGPHALRVRLVVPAAGNRSGRQD